MRNKILWSNETKIEIFGVTSRENLAQSLWGSMVVAASCCGDVVGTLVMFEGKMNGAKCREILDENLLQSAEDLRLGAKVNLPTGQRP